MHDNMYDLLMSDEDKPEVLELIHTIKTTGGLAKANMLVDDTNAAAMAMAATMAATDDFLVTASLLPMLEMLVRGGDAEDELGHMLQHISSIHIIKHEKGEDSKDMPTLYTRWKSYKDALEFYEATVAEFDAVETVDGTPEGK